MLVVMPSLKKTEIDVGNNILQRRFCPLLETFCPVGVHFAQTVVHFAHLQV